MPRLRLPVTWALVWVILMAALDKTVATATPDAGVLSRPITPAFAITATLGTSAFTVQGLTELLRTFTDTNKLVNFAPQRAPDVAENAHLGPGIS
jgi:hypothetical protein